MGSYGCERPRANQLDRKCGRDGADSGDGGVAAGATGAGMFFQPRARRRHSLVQQVSVTSFTKLFLLVPFHLMWVLQEFDLW